MDVNYALLAFRRSGALPSIVKLQDIALIDDIRINEILDPVKIEHWKMWLGKLRWDQLNRCDTMFMVQGPRVGEGDDAFLLQRATNSWYALILADGKPPFHGPAFKLSGTAEKLGETITNLDIKVFSEFRSPVRPAYDRSMKFIRILRQGRRDETWFQEMAIFYDLIEHWQTGKNITSILHDALESYVDAKCSNQIGTAIARYVEAAEAILAMPKRPSGADEFARRASRLMGPPEVDEFFDWDQQECADFRFSELYKLRNSRNHGKGTRDSIQYLLSDVSKDAADETIAKWYFLAERLARTSIRVLLTHPEGRTLAKSRDELETAWTSRRFP